eukprot:1194959-Prorocentrum_minimum.AAC.6
MVADILTKLLPKGPKISLPQKLFTLPLQREVIKAQLAEEIERDLEVFGATAVEDKLQEGVPETLEQLLRAGLRVCASQKCRVVEVKCTPGVSPNQPCLRALSEFLSKDRPDLSVSPVGAATQ